MASVWAQNLFAQKLLLLPLVEAPWPGKQKIHDGFRSMPLERCLNQLKLHHVFS
jgi:hypothetical protein